MFGLLDPFPVPTRIPEVPPQPPRGGGRDKADCIGITSQILDALQGPSRMLLLELGTLFLLCSDEVFQILMVVYGWDDILPGRVLSRCVHDQNRSEAEEESKIFLISALWVPENLVDKDSFEKVESSMVLLT